MTASRVVLFCFLFLISSAPARESLAAEWSLDPSIGVRGEYNTNLLITHLDHKPVWGTWVSPGIKFAGTTERLEINGKASVDFVRYTGGQDEEFTNVFLPLSARYKTEHDTFGFDGGYTRDNTLMGELLTTGMLIRFTQRNLWTASPTWTRELTEQLSFQVGYQFSNASYENGRRLGLLDYELHGGTAALIYQASERTKVQVVGNYLRFETKGFPFQATAPGATLSLTHSLSETLTVTAAGGPRVITTSFQSSRVGLKDSETVWTYNTSILKEFEHSGIQIGYSRDIFPSGFGLLIRNDQISAIVSTTLSHSLTAALDARYNWVTGQTTTALGGRLPDATFIHLSPKLTWRINEWWSLESSYTYRTFDAETFSNAGHSHSTQLMLTWHPTKLTISR